MAWEEKHTHLASQSQPTQPWHDITTKGLATPGAGSGRGDHPRDCGRVTPGAGSGEGGHPRDCGCMTPGTGSGRGVILETVDV